MQFREKARLTLVLCLAFAGAGTQLAGCQGTGATEPPAGLPATVAAPAEPGRPAVDVDPAEILALLDQAEAAMTRGQLTYPADGSALILFDTVIAMDPDNEEAQRGLERIVEYYLEQAATEAQRNQLASARAMLERARLIDPHSPGVTATEAQLELLATARRNRLVLDRAQLASRSSALGTPLKSLGGQAREPNCRAIIRVRNDAEGRWVYQQMSLAPGESRIRAEIQIGSPPLVELVCFHEG